MLWNAFPKKKSCKIVRKVITVMRPEIIGLQEVSYAADFGWVVVQTSAVYICLIDSR